MDRLNHSDVNVRLEALSEIIKDMPKSEPSGNVNNHIHTFYSFSPYSPTKAVYMAKKAGLDTAGIMDHDSVSGCREFIKAGEIAGLPTTVGCECRVSMKGTALTRAVLHMLQCTQFLIKILKKLPNFLNPMLKKEISATAL